MVAAVAVGAVFAATRDSDSTPDIRLPFSENARVTAGQLSAPEEFCAVALAWNISGIEGRVSADLPTLPKYVGSGGKVTTGTVAGEVCVNGADVQIDDAQEGSEAFIDVRVPQSAIRQDIRFDELATSIEPLNPPRLRSLAGFLGNEALVRNCERFSDYLESLGTDGFYCKDLQALNTIQETDPTALDRTVRTGILEFMRDTCLPLAEQTGTPEAFTEPYRSQVRELGGDPDKVRLQIVDDQGNQANLPSVTSDETIAALRSQGVLTDEPSGLVSFQLDNESCRPFPVVAVN